MREALALIFLLTIFTSVISCEPYGIPAKLRGQLPILQVRKPHVGQALHPQERKAAARLPQEAGQGRLQGGTSPGGPGSEAVRRILRTANSIPFDTFTESLSAYFSRGDYS